MLLQNRNQLAIFEQQRSGHILGSRKIMVLKRIGLSQSERSYSLLKLTTQISSSDQFVRLMFPNLLRPFMISLSLQENPCRWQHEYKNHWQAKRAGEIQKGFSVVFLGTTTLTSKDFFQNIPLKYTRVVAILLKSFHSMLTSRVRSWSRLSRRKLLLFTAKTPFTDKRSKRKAMRDQLRSYSTSYLQC